MLGTKEHLTRRKLLKIGALPGLGAAVGVLLNKADELENRWYSPETDLSRFVENSEFKLFGPSAPEELTGVMINSSFAWKTPDRTHVRELLKKCEGLGATQIRIFLDDDVERKLGTVRMDKLQKAKQFCQEVWEISQGKVKVSVDLFDCYRLLRSEIWNPNYGTKPLSSPYLLRGQIREELEGAEVEKRQKEFFTDPNMIDFFKKRIRVIVDYLKDEPVISSWCVANEPYTELNDLTSWYEEVTPVVTDADPNDRPIFSGVARPWYVDEKRIIKKGISANTLHWYDEMDSKEYKEIIDYLYRQNPILPISLQEIGRATQFNLTLPNVQSGIFSFLKKISLSFSPPESDTFMNTYYIDTTIGLLKSEGKNTDGKNTILLPFFQLGGWQIQVGDLNRDGYNTDPDLYPQTAETFNQYVKMFGKTHI